MGEDLDELLRRRALTEDAARPDAVERRHAAGGRTARENLADLVDPGSFVEYGRFAIAAQRGAPRGRGPDRAHARRRLRGRHGERQRRALRRAAACAVLSYDYTVLAGTQGALGHRKKDRLFELIERMRLPAVLFAEGGGGRPGDTDYPVVSALDARAFALWAKLSGLVPRIAVVAGRCFAGNAVLAGCSDLIVATENVSLGMGGPAMIEGGGLGTVDAGRDRAARDAGRQRRDRRRRRRRGRGDGADQEAARLFPGRHAARAPPPTRTVSATSCRNASAAPTPWRRSSRRSPTRAR